MIRLPATTTSLALAIAAMMATPAFGQSLPFNGTRENVNPLNPPGGRCVPPYFLTVNIAPGALSSTGTSNISNFTSTQSHCITSAPPTSVVEGQFTYAFEGGDSIFGTYTGGVATSATPGTFNAIENLIITGGTGRFVGASGTINSNGTLRFANGNGIFQGTLNGSILAPTTTMSGIFSTALGVPSAATGEYSTAIGAFSFASGARSTALGSFAEATGPGSVALGDNTFSSGASSVALGQNATATAPAAHALGHNSVASGLASTAVGVRAQATGIGSVSVGQLSGATADNATAVGARSSAAFAGSTAIGAGAATTAVNQVSLGGAGTSVRVGDIAASTTAQQASSVGVATVDGNGTLGRDTTLFGSVTSMQSNQASQGTAIAALQSDSLSLFDLTRDNRNDIREANEGVAMALAMDTPSIPAGARVAVSGGVGYFKNRSALASAISVAVGQMSSVSAGLGYGFKSKDVGARAGFQIAW